MPANLYSIKQIFINSSYVNAEVPIKKDTSCTIEGNYNNETVPYFRNSQSTYFIF